MKKALVLLAILFLAYTNGFGQEEYSSALQDNYHQEQRELYSHRYLPDINDVMNFDSPYCKIQEIENYSAYVDSIIWRTPYMDSIINREMAQITAGNYDYTDEQEKLGGIYKGSIIKHGKKGTLEAFIYTSGKYSDIFWGDPGIWIALSRDAGETWEHYFTGLYEYQPIIPKWYSNLPLIVEENILQIEVAFVQQTEEHSHPIPSQKYKLIRDGLVAIFDMNLIAADSDGDGLTDIVEEKFRTNPRNNDTNGNGISDDLDLNPRQNLQRTENTIVFENIIDKGFMPMTWEEVDYRISLPDSVKEKELAKDWDWADIPTRTPNESYANDSIQTVLIVTDDPNIKAVRPRYVRVIILSSEEYIKSSHLRFKTELDMLSVSPMLKVDGKDDLYLIEYSYMTGGTTYLIQKTKNGWRIKPILVYIS